MNQQLSIVSSHKHPGQNHCESSSVFVIHRLIKGAVPTPIRLDLKYEPRNIRAVVSDMGTRPHALEDFLMLPESD